MPQLVFKKVLRLFIVIEIFYKFNNNFMESLTD